MENKQINKLKKKIKSLATIDLIIYFAEAITILVLAIVLIMGCIDIINNTDTTPRTGDALGNLSKLSVVFFSKLAIGIKGVPGLFFSFSIVWSAIATYRKVHKDDYVKIEVFNNAAIIFLMFLFRKALIGKDIFIIFMIAEAVVFINIAIINKMKKKLKELQGTENKEIKEEEKQEEGEGENE